VGNAGRAATPLELEDFSDTARCRSLHDRPVHHEHRPPQEISRTRLRARNPAHDHGRIRRFVSQLARRAAVEEWEFWYCQNCFLCELCGCSLRPLRLKVLTFRRAAPTSSLCTAPPPQTYKESTKPRGIPPAACVPAFHRAQETARPTPADMRKDLALPKSQFRQQAALS